jgi:HlyD family secretion protein
MPEDARLPAGHEASVFVLSADGHSAHRETIKMGRRNGSQVEVLSGLTPGDKVAVAGFANAQTAPQFLVTE